MKGALLDYIRATVGQAIKSASNIIYTNPPSLSVLPGNGLVTKDMLTGYVPTPSPTIIALGAGDPQYYDYDYGSDIEADGIEIYAETYYTHPTYGDCLIPYTLNYFKQIGTNHIILARADVGDIVKVTIKA